MTHIAHDVKIDALISRLTHRKPHPSVLSFTNFTFYKLSGSQS